MGEPILAIRDLKVRFRTNDGPCEAVRGIDLDVGPGEFVAVVGESGSGKSQSVMAAMGLLASNGEVTGAIRYREVDLLKLPPPVLNSYRGKKLAMIFQEPMTSLDPLFRIGTQMAAPLRKHQGLSRKAARARALELLKLVRIPYPERRLDSYPHELSGGQRQRVMIAMALANNPDILIADEPTTALDVTIEAEILALIAELRQRLGMAVILISHDLGLVRKYAERVYVMKAGEVVESGSAQAIFEAPQHPYTKALLAAEPHGHKAPPPADAPVLLEARDLRVSFDLSRGFLKREKVTLHAVDGVDLTVRRGQTIGIVGESGSGQVDARTRAAQAPALVRDRSLRGSGAGPARPRRDAALAPQPAGRVPGPVRLALAAPHRRRDHHRGFAGARARFVTRRARAASGGGPDRGLPRPGPAQPLSARILGWPAPAHRHRPRHDPAPGAGRAGRADLGARPHCAAEHRRPAQGPAGEARPLLPLHQPRPRSGAPPWPTRSW